MTPSHWHPCEETSSDSDSHGHSWESTLSLTTYNVRFLLFLKIQEEAYGRGKGWEGLLESETPCWRVPWERTAVVRDPHWSRDTTKGTAACR